MSTLKSNIRAALFVHITTLINSFVVGLILPKFLSVESFGYWQYFAFFSGCLELLLFGAGTGLYLHFGGKAYEQIDKSMIRHIFFRWLCVAVVLIVVGGVMIHVIRMDPEKKYIFNILLIGLVVINTGTFFSYILQSTNRIKDNLSTVLLLNFITIAGFSILMCFNVTDYSCYISLYIGAHFLRGILILYYNKTVFMNHCVKQKKQRPWNVRPIIQAGMFLMMADYSIYLMFGIGRLFVENKWGIEVFSKFSFAMSLTLLMVTFINQIGLVLFPALKQLKYEKMKELIIQYHKKVDMVLLSVFILYFAAKEILVFWLPQYEEAVFYFGVLLPLCVFDGRIAMLLNPVLKALRKEKQILYINVSFLLVSSLSFLTLWISGASIYYYCVLFVLISIGRSFFSEWIMDRTLSLDFNKRGFACKLGISSMFYAILTWEVLK